MHSIPLPYILSTIQLILLLHIVNHLISLPPPPFKFETATPHTLSLSSPDASATRKALEKLSRILVTNYTSWHKKTRAKLEACRGCRQTPPIKYLLAHGKNASNGLGDRFRGIIHAYLCAVGSNRFLMLDVPLPYPIGTAFGPGLSSFSYDKTILPSKAQITRLKGRAVRFDAFENFLGDEDVVIIDSDPSPKLKHFYNLSMRLPDLPVSKELKAVGGSLDLVTDSELYATIFGAMFRITGDMRTVLEGLVTGKEGAMERLWNKEMKRIDVSHNYLSVHARLGYGLGEGRIKRFNLTKKGFTMEYVADCMAGPAVRISKERGVDPVRIYLGTDTPEFAEMFRRAVKRKGGGVVMTANFEPEHVRSIKNNKKDMKTYLEIFVDLYLLSRGVALLHFKSGFADLAAWMGGIRHRGMYFLGDYCGITLY